MIQLKVGSQVQFRSGNSLMTVLEITGNRCLCIWFNEQVMTTVTVPSYKLLEYLGSQAGADSYSVGDRVKLKSGSPIMTIQELDGDNCSCTWLNRRIMEKAIFPIQTLMPESSCVTHTAKSPQRQDSLEIVLNITIENAKGALIRDPLSNNVVDMQAFKKRHNR